MCVRGRKERGRQPVTRPREKRDLTVTAGASERTSGKRGTDGWMGWFGTPVLFKLLTRYTFVVTLRNAVSHFLAGSERARAPLE